MSDPPRHARFGRALEGIEGPTRAFLDALDRGRLHHAWLLTGPQGVGKAGFAYQAACRLLGARPDPAAGELHSVAGDPVGRMVAARSHPDLLVLERAVEEGPARRGIPVDEARALPEFFSKAPAIARYRVAIIDAADDLNVNAANAVLKTLEEPSGRGVLLLVSHAPGRLLATLKSRCRRLAFPPWSHDDLVAFIQAHTELAGPDVHRLAQMAHGAPGRALSLLDQDALDLDRQAGAVLALLCAPDPATLLTLADSFRGGEGAQRFHLLLDRLADRVGAATVQAAMADGLGDAAAPWVQVWDRLNALPSQVEGLNLDRADAVWSLIAELSQITRTHPLPC